MSSRPRRPGGHAAPEVARLAGETVDLGPLAAEICRRYRAEFPDEHDRYGEAGIAWCLHDNRHIVNWAIEAIEVGADLDRNLSWLAGVLETRDFPVDRLVRDLELAADVVRDLVPGATALEERLRAGTRRSRRVDGPPTRVTPSSPVATARRCATEAREPRRR